MDVTSDRNEQVMMGFYVEPELREKFKALAKHNGRTVSGELRHMMRRSVESYERRQKDAA